MYTENILRGNEFLTHVLGWILESETPVEGGSTFYTYIQYKKGKEVHRYEGGDASILKPGQFIPYYQDWEFLIDAVAEIETNDKIKTYAQLFHVDDEIGVGIEVNIRGKIPYRYYWYYSAEKEQMTKYFVKSKREATFKAVVDIFRAVKKYL